MSPPEEPPRAAGEPGKPRLTRQNWADRQFAILLGKCLPNCQEVIRMASESMDRPLSLGQRLKVYSHFLICRWCRRYARQIETLRKFARALPEEMGAALPEKLDDEARERLKRALRESGAAGS